MTSTLDLNLSTGFPINFGTPFSIVCSSDGQTISVGGRKIYNNVSYGNPSTNWYANTQPTGTNQKWISICSTASGNYLFGINGTPSSTIYSSNNSNENIGTVWTPITQIIGNCNGICCSTSGNIVAINLSPYYIYYTTNGLSTSPTWGSVNYTSNYGSNLLCCSNDGKIIAFLNSSTENYEGFNLVVGYYENNNYLFIYATETLLGNIGASSICISDLGEYIHVCTEGNETTYNGNVYTYRFVNNVLTLLYQPPNPDSTLSWTWSAICCDSTGQYVAAVLSTLYNNNSGIYISNDYGNSYQGFNISTDPNNLYNWTTCCCDSNFKYLFLTNSNTGIYQAILNILPPTPTPDPDPTPTPDPDPTPTPEPDPTPTPEPDPTPTPRPPPTPNNNFSTPNIILNENTDKTWQISITFNNFIPILNNSYVLINQMGTIVSEIYIPNTNTNTFVFKKGVLYQGFNILQIYNISGNELSNIFKIDLSTKCFNEQTKILCLVDSVEKYIPIEELNETIHVKTYKHGYRKIKYLIKSTLLNVQENTINKLYKLIKTENNNLIEDLYLTGGHSILKDNLSEKEIIKMKKLIENKNIKFDYKINDKYKLLVCFDKSFQEYNKKGYYNIYQLVLDNDNNVEKNYGIYANGLLVESTNDICLVK